MHQTGLPVVSAPATVVIAACSRKRISHCVVFLFKNDGKLFWILKKRSLKLCEVFCKSSMRMILICAA